MRTQRIRELLAVLKKVKALERLSVMALLAEKEENTHHLGPGSIRKEKEQQLANERRKENYC